MFLTSTPKLFNSLYFSCTFQSKLNCLNVGPFVPSSFFITSAYGGALCLSLLIPFLFFHGLNHSLCLGLCHSLIGCHFFICFCLFKSKLLFSVWLFSIFVCSSLPYVRLLLLLTPCNIIHIEGR